MPVGESALTVHGRAGSDAEIGLFVVFGGTLTTSAPLTVTVIATEVPLLMLSWLELSDSGPVVGDGAAQANTERANATAAVTGAL